MLAGRGKHCDKDTVMVLPIFILEEGESEFVSHSYNSDFSVTLGHPRE